MLPASVTEGGDSSTATAATDGCGAPLTPTLPTAPTSAAATTTGNAAVAAMSQSGRRQSVAVDEAISANTDTVNGSNMAADERRRLTEATEATEATMVQILWPLPILLSVSVAADRRR